MRHYFLCSLKEKVHHWIKRIKKMQQKSIAIACFFVPFLVLLHALFKVMQ